MVEVTHAQAESGSKPHDKLIRDVFGQSKYFKHLLRVFLSEASLRELDLDAVKTMPTSRFDRRGAEQVADVIGSVRSVPLDESRELVVVVEHKSVRDSNTLLQLSGYLREVRRQHPDAWILAVVLYNGVERQWNRPLEYFETVEGPPSALADELGGKLMKFHFCSLLLNVHDEAMQRRAYNLPIGIVICILQRIWDLTDDVVAGIVTRSLKLENDDRTWLMRAVMRYILKMRSDYNWDRLIDIETRVVEKEKRIMPALLESDKDLIQEGRVEGRAEGLNEAAANMLRDGVEDETVARYTGLASKTISNLKRKLNGA